MDPQDLIDLEITREDYLICADAGYRYLEGTGLKADAVLGDFDSMPVPSEENVVRYPSEKDDTDMMIAVKKGLEEKCRSFILTGALGGRLDHTIANISALSYLCDRGIKGLIYSKDCVIVLLENETMVMEKKPGFFISVFSYGERCEGVTLKGLKYPLDNAVLDQSFPLGVSNEFSEEKAEIGVKNGKLLVVMVRME